MKSRLMAAAISAMLIFPAAALAQTAGQGTLEDLSRALELYGNGMFERAGTLFGELADKGDVTAEGYQVLCAIRLQETGCETMASRFVTEHPYSSLVPQIHFYNGLNLFDYQDYGAAAEEFSSVSRENLSSGQLPELLFKQSYSYYELGLVDEAQSGFTQAEKLPQSDYTAPSRYFLAYILYTKKNFKEAYDWFEMASRDPRFSDISKYYMIECRYMQKDYSYVISNGVPAFSEVPKDRQAHLARIISESYLATGQTGKARDYYEKIETSSRDMERDDFFYAGSVLYAVEDFKGAIDNYTMMTDRTDSIGQIANYQLAYSYIRTGNKVAAMDSFKDASGQSYNPDVQEDAYFNYAKLSFDLNHNPTVFNEYMSKYPAQENNDRIYSYMALASLYSHDYAGAVEAYSNIDYLDDDQKGNYMRANYLRANELIGNGSWRDAVPLLKAASYYADKRSTFSQLSRYWLGESYYRSDQYENAIETFSDLYNNSALEGKKEGERIPYDLAYSYFRNADYTNAAKWFDKYLQARNPSEGEDAASRRADCDFVRKDYKTAINEYEAATKRFSYSDNLYPYYQTGLAYGLLGDNDKKIAALSKAKSVGKDAAYWSETMYELGRAYVVGDRTSDAVDCFKELRNGTADKAISAKTLIELGMISRNMSEYDEALGYYKQVVAEMPDTEYSEDALLAIESIYQSEGRTDEYLAYADKVGAIKDKSESQREDLYFNAAEQLFLSENYSKALSSFQTYLERYPDGSKVGQAYYCTGECYRQLGKKELACDWLKKSIVQDPDGAYSETAMLNFANLSYELQHYDDAYGAYASLSGSARIDNNRHAALVGMMQSAFKGQKHENAIASAGKVASDRKSTEAELRQADYVRAKSNLSLGNRAEAFEIFTALSARPSTAEGAEAAYMIIQDAYDQGNYGTVESKVYKFADSAGDQSYWLAKSYIVLGDTFVENDNLSQAKATFESVLNGYQPASGTSDDVLDGVRMRLGKLKNMMNE